MSPEIAARVAALNLECRCAGLADPFFNKQLDTAFLTRSPQMYARGMTVADLEGPWGLELRIPDDRVGHVLDALPKGGGTLDVSFILATDPGVDPDMRAWTRRTGNELIDIAKDGTVFHVLVRRAGE